MLKNRTFFIAALGLIWLASCGGNGPKNDNPTGPDCSGLVCHEVIETGEVTLDGENASYQLLRISSPTDEPSYALWIPPKSDVPSAAILMANPYDGIDWSGEDVDNRWATNRGTAGCYEDLDGPDYLAGVSQPICYGGTISPQQSAEQAAFFLLNDVGVLMVYGRFYAGGSPLEYIDAMVSGLEFLSEADEVDPSNVGVFGISLGGFEALHAAARAPITIQPLVGVGVSPLLDFQNIAAYVEQVLPNAISQANQSTLDEYISFFEPYLRRAYRNSGGPIGASSDFSDINLDPLTTGLEGEYLLIHDDWDTLVPVEQSKSLVASSDQIEGLWFPHQTAIDYDNFVSAHQQPGEGQTLSVSLAFSQAFLLNRLTAQNQTISVYYDWNELAEFFLYIRQQQIAGSNIDWLISRLIEFSDSRVIAIDYSSAGIEEAPGYHIVGLFLNGVWGANLDELSFSTNVRDYLESSGLN